MCRVSIVKCKYFFFSLSITLHRASTVWNFCWHKLAGHRNSLLLSHRRNGKSVNKRVTHYAGRETTSDQTHFGRSKCQKTQKFHTFRALETKTQTSNWSAMAHSRNHSRVIVHHTPDQVNIYLNSRVHLFTYYHRSPARSRVGEEKFLAREGDNLVRAH